MYVQGSIECAHESAIRRATQRACLVCGLWLHTHPDPRPTMPQFDPQDLSPRPTKTETADRGDRGVLELRHVSGLRWRSRTKRVRHVKKGVRKKKNEWEGSLGEAPILRQRITPCGWRKGYLSRPAHVHKTIQEAGG